MKLYHLHFIPLTFLLMACGWVTFSVPTPVSLGQATPLPPTLPSTGTALDGLTYANLDSAQIFRITAGGQGVAILQGTSARFSTDGILALFESSGDIFLAEPMDNPGFNLTHTPDRSERTPQWLPLDPMKIVFNSKGMNEALADGPGGESLGYLSMMNLDGSEYTVLSDIPSYTAPALISDGRTIAYEQRGVPMLYEIGKGSRPFDPTLYGYPPGADAIFTSPSFSAFGRWLTWWVSEDSSKPDQQFSLVLFDLSTNTSIRLHTYRPPAGTSGWLPSPVWNGDEGWIAYQTRGEVTSSELWISHPDGSEAHRLGFVTNPVWDPDLERLAYVQWPPRPDSYLAASLSVIDVPSMHVQQINLPAGSIPLAWTLPALLNPDYFPRFVAPAEWPTHSNANPPYQIRYPPSAKLDATPERLTIDLLGQHGEPPAEKSITIEARVGTIEDCYAFSLWDGKTMLNGFDLKYNGGKNWETGSDGTRFLLGNYAIYRDGFCTTIQSRMTAPGGLFPPGENMDPEILLNIISTLTLY